MDRPLLCWTFCLTIQELPIRHFQNSSDMFDVTDGFREACIIHCTCSDSVIGKDFHVKRLCPVCKILSETALALGHLLYMDMSPSSKNVMGHSRGTQPYRPYQQTYGGSALFMVVMQWVGWFPGKSIIGLPRTGTGHESVCKQTYRPKDECSQMY